jgi:hypothetical protein
MHQCAGEAGRGRRPKPAVSPPRREISTEDAAASAVDGGWLEVEDIDPTPANCWAQSATPQCRRRQSDTPRRCHDAES